MQTMHINQAVKNNPNKFPEGHVFQLKANEYDTLRAMSDSSKLTDNQDPIKNFDRALTINNLEKTTVMPNRFGKSKTHCEERG